MHSDGDDSRAGPDRVAVGTGLLEETEEMLAGLRGDRRAEPQFQAFAQAAKQIAEQLDRDPSKPSLWKEFRELVKELTEDDGGDGGVDDLLAELRAPVGDAQED